MALKNRIYSKITLLTMILKKSEKFVARMDQKMKKFTTF